MRNKKKEWMFLFVCLLLGILAEVSFLHGEIGVAYIIFIAAFYTVLFIRFRFSFDHRRIGLLMMVGIWVLAASYLIYDSTLFYYLNIVAIPAVVLFHIVLITSPGSLNWSKLSFVKLVTSKLLDALKFLTDYLSYIIKKITRSRKRGNNGTIQQVMIGIVLAVPLLFVVIQLLMSADEAFRQFVQRMFYFPTERNIVEIGFRIAFILIATLFFFCVFKVLEKKTKREINQSVSVRDFPAPMAATVLILLNAVYLLFIAVQFQYFFHDGLHEGFTYAGYARRGFFELILVTLINWIVLLGFLKRVKDEGLRTKRLLQILYSLLIVTSGILLLSSWNRLTLYEEMYGFTMDRLLAHSFMAFLIVIFAYTLIRVWLENLPILHFYLISAFVFYTLLNAVNLEEIIVENNLERYETTGKIDIHYLNLLGAEGTKGLIALYEQDPDCPELKLLLIDKKERLIDMNNDSWQSFNFARKKAEKLLMELEL